METTIDWLETQNEANTCKVCGTMGYGNTPKQKDSQGKFITVWYECPRCHNNWTAYFGYAFYISETHHESL